MTQLVRVNVLCPRDTEDHCCRMGFHDCCHWVHKDQTPFNAVWRLSSEDTWKTHINSIPDSQVMGQEIKDEKGVVHNLPTWVVGMNDEYAVRCLAATSLSKERTADARRYGIPRAVEVARTYGRVSICGSLLYSKAELNPRWPKTSITQGRWTVWSLPGQFDRSVGFYRACGGRMEADAGRVEQGVVIMEAQATFKYSMKTYLQADGGLGR